MPCTPAPLQLVLGEHESATAPVSVLFDGQRRLPLKLRFFDYASPRLRERLQAAT